MIERFTVEPYYPLEGERTGEYAIRYTPPDGGLSFHALIAGDLLSDQEKVLQHVADVLNASDIG